MCDNHGIYRVLSLGNRGNILKLSTNFLNLEVALSALFRDGFKVHILKEYDKNFFKKYTFGQSQFGKVHILMLVKMLGCCLVTLTMVIN